MLSKRPSHTQNILSTLGRCTELIFLIENLGSKCNQINDRELCRTI
jgi:hypothetical protein